MEYVIEVKNIKKYYNKGKIKALDDLSFNIREGRVYGLIGPNGAGKTTIIKTILGAISPTKGSVTIYGEKAGSITANERIGYVCEKTALPLNDDPYEYLLSMAILSKISIKDAKEMIIKYIEQFGLTNFMFDKMKKFSSGMKKKVQIISALLSNPSILVLDEPTANLDPKVRFEIFNFIKSITLSNHITVILCSHNLFELEKIVDDILMIRKGKLIIQGSFLEILDAIKPKQRLLLKTSNDELALEFIKDFKQWEITQTAPIMIETEDLRLFKEKIIEFAFKNKIIIDEIKEIRDSLFELFDYFNEKQEGGVVNNDAV